MPLYDVYQIDHANRRAAADVEDISFPDDEAAIAFVSDRVPQDAAVEVWEGLRLVIRIGPAPDFSTGTDQAA